MSGLLYGVRAIDGTTFLTVAVLLTSTALAGSCIPAWRAMHVNPIDALGSE